MPTDRNEFLRELKLEVEAELVVVGSSHPDEAPGVSPERCLFDPTDVARQQAGLRSLLGAVAEMESDAHTAP